MGARGRMGLLMGWRMGRGRSEVLGFFYMVRSYEQVFLEFLEALQVFCNRDSVVVG